jgi:hypothetical protein
MINDSLASSNCGHVTFFTHRAGWAYDYGTSQDSKEMFEYIKGYHQYKTQTQIHPATGYHEITMTE